MTAPDASTAKAIAAALISPNEHDSNFEPANVVDGLFAIARAVESLTTAVTRIAYGGIDGPTGLEMLSMAINGPGDAGNNPVSQAILEGFQDVANAIREASAAP